MAMVIQGGGVTPVAFQRAMVFIDGTNLFYRLKASKLKLRSIESICENAIEGRQIVRIYLYTSRPHHEEALKVHGDRPFRKVRQIFGNAVPTKDGNFKEKGVDALLVTDLIYHGAQKNYDLAILISVDTDFAGALKRVEDFGCRTAVISICAHAPELLRQSADAVFEYDADRLVSEKWAQRL